ncbi:hypothetical protein A3E65_01145 [Candidatus Kaiserbacteria bacterium RIFCSPHIGHO2_12_FULL_56_13]|uniref:CARDB domain-containing protein n=2 Tax=Candidatus Kaiseribacteriota TaxID=1752734 RepID=A0A1F6E2U6_9BACT|nr:MAG: hypothetical protein A3C95_00920 [Candidatus Kaiserbacteria bacterium RIFCSPHIGHO2_02_FULL_56_30]OGG71945.1 MAG: hypothetical protein A3E65_01145 [Candidatus Kaiserbacteria bacterium RIFCSPHIGHO2_12_FULL_56_13]
MNRDEAVGVLTAREAIERGLAIVGFIALVAFGIWLAIYGSRFVPTAIGRLGAAAVALTSVFVPAEPALSIVPTTTIPFGEATNTFDELIEEPTAPATPASPVSPSPGARTSATFPISGTTTPPSTTVLPMGLPDLTATITAVGLLTASTTESFLATTTVMGGLRPAVKFSIQNIGTNVATSGWHFSAAIPTQTAYVFYSPTQQALGPGDRIEYVLGFDQASPGENRSISIVADSSQNVGESNENNNGSTATITIIGS